MATVRDRQTLTPSTIELKAFLAEHWTVLELHALKHLTVTECAQRAGMLEENVRRILAESWRIGITPNCVQSYMEGAL